VTCLTHLPNGTQVRCRDEHAFVLPKPGAR
jgi:hypothetical protein